MESLSVALQPYKETVGSVASVLTILQFFSGSIICFEIYKKGNTNGTSITPFVGGAALGALVLKYAIILQDQAMFQVNMAAIILNVAYLSWYFYFSQNKYKEAFVPSVKGLLLVVTVLTYLQWEDPSKIEFRYGLIVTILMLALLGSPLIEIKDIVRKRDASSIPFPITFMAFFVTILWLLYGIILQNEFMVIQNFVGVLLCFTQLVLCAYYTGDRKYHKD